MRNTSIPKSGHIGLRVPPDVKERLARIAALDDRSISYVVLRAVREWTAKHDPAPKVEKETAE